jgi:hypothetical protein
LFSTEQIEFEPVAHTYSVAGQAYDGVTRVISAVLRDQSRWWKPEDRMRGTMVHAITEAIDAGDWDADATVIPDGFDRQGIIQRGEAYQHFIHLSGFQALKVECRVASPSLRLAGTLDRFGLIAKGTHAGRHAILDLKSGAPTPSAILQAALYQKLLLDTFPSLHLAAPPLRIILHLKPNGKARPEYREGNADIMDALAIVRTYRFMEREGLLKTV